MRKYCFDTSAFISSWRIYYPPGVFPSLWDKLAEMIEEGRIIIPKEVEREILAGNDDLKTWFRSNRKMVVPLDSRQVTAASDIVNKYPKVSQYHKPRPYHADPFVVALAKVEHATVVTYEKPNGSRDNPRIPDLCQEYDVECYDMKEFFEKEGIKFKS